MYVQLLMNIPFMAIYFASYEGAKQALLDYAGGEETLLIQGVAGGAAGGAAAAFTTPLDVVKTRLQLEGVSSPVRYMSMNVVHSLPQRHDVKLMQACKSHLPKDFCKTGAILSTNAASSCWLVTVTNGAVFGICVVTRNWPNLLNFWTQILRA